MGKSNKVTEDEVAEIWRLYRAGYRIGEVAQMTSRSGRTVGQIVGTRQPQPSRAKDRCKKPVCSESSPPAVEPPVEKAPVSYWPDGWMIKQPTMAQLRAGR